MTPELRWATMTAVLTVSLTVSDKVTTQYLQTTSFEERGVPKRNRTEVLVFTSQRLTATPSRLTNDRGGGGGGGIRLLLFTIVSQTTEEEKSVSFYSVVSGLLTEVFQNKDQRPTDLYPATTNLINETLSGLDGSNCVVADRHLSQRLKLSQD